MKSKKTNINKEVAHISKEVLENVKKSQKTAKKDAKTAKLYSEDQICKIACMVFMLETQVARATAAIGCFFSDDLTKHDLLKEFMAIDRTMRKYTRDFHEEIESTIGSKDFGCMMIKPNELEKALKEKGII